MTARAHRDERSDELAGNGRSVEAWFGVLGGPAAGFLLVLVNYPVVSRACVTDSSIWLHVVQALFLGIALLAGLSAWHLHRRVAGFPENSGEKGSRIRFMASVGLMASGLAVVEIILTWIPIFFIGACHGT